MDGYDSMLFISAATIHGINLAIWPLMARVMTLRISLFFLNIKEVKGKEGGEVQDSATEKHNGQAENDLFHVWLVK